MPQRTRLCWQQHRLSIHQPSYHKGRSAGIRQGGHVGMHIMPMLERKKRLFEKWSSCTSYVHSSVIGLTTAHQKTNMADSHTEVSLPVHSHNSVVRSRYKYGTAAGDMRIFFGERGTVCLDQLDNRFPCCIDQQQYDFAHLSQRRHSRQVPERCSQGQQNHSSRDDHRRHHHYFRRWIQYWCLYGLRSMYYVQLAT